MSSSLAPTCRRESSQNLYRILAFVGCNELRPRAACHCKIKFVSPSAKKLDEGLQILAGLWTEDPFSFAGEYYTVDQVTFLTKPVQSPRIPLWVVAGWPHHAPFRRAARWDGVCVKAIHHQTYEWMTVDAFREAFSYVQARCAPGKPFEVIMSGQTPRDQQEAGEKVRPFEQAGATWWVEVGYGLTFEEFRERIRRGPPRLL